MDTLAIESPLACHLFIVFTHQININDLIYVYVLGVDRLSAPILSILPIIDIGHFQNIFADNVFFFFNNANKHTIYR